MPYIAPEVITEAKRMDLLTYLRTYEPGELVRYSGNTYCTREHDSLKISNGKWMWWSRGIGGKSALDYLIKVKGLDFIEAVETIMGQCAVSAPVYEKENWSYENQPLLLPQKSPSNDVVTQYLFSRGIDYEIISFCTEADGTPTAKNKIQETEREVITMTENFTPAKAGGQRPRLSKEEYAEKKRAEKDAVYQLADEAAKEIVSSPEKFKAFLDTQSRLDRYSAVNALLIYKQYPQAVQLKDFDDWSKDNIKITKGAKSISILEPVEYAKRDGTTGISYNVKKVFDVAQTNGKRPPAPTANRDPKALITTMLDSSPVNVEATNDLPYPNMAAFYNNEEQTLYVKRDVGDSVAVAQCVAQELGHAQLSINSDSYSRSDMGFQAVCIGYMLCKKYGIDTQNFAINRIPDKLANKEPKDIRFELTKTRNAMADIHSRVSDELYKKKQARSKDYER